MSSIKCKVVADKVWYSKESRFLAPDEIVEFPAEVVNHEGKTVPFKVGPSFELVAEGKKAKKEKAEEEKPDSNPAADLT